MMRVVFLFLLTMLLGLMIYLKVEMDEAKRASNETEAEYIFEKYTISERDDSGYYGASRDGKSIYFKKEKVPDHEKIENGDSVLVYFDKSGRIDGPVKIEKID
ncbi:hypothetical protein [Mesobacillus subterraneus]|uniref:hypothetical protein n=1 Tax=Mesobacillus subterraneus TaxID=285983 RepID=UPI001CFDF7A8|nr:hypothetical protein [Mesobacillus subterraneus]